MTIRTIGCLLFGTFAKATAPASDTGRPSPAEIAIVDVGQIRRRGVRADGARIPLVHGRDRGGKGLGDVGIEGPEGGRDRTIVGVAGLQPADAHTLGAGGPQLNPRGVEAVAPAVDVL